MAKENRAKHKKDTVSITSEFVGDIDHGKELKEQDFTGSPVDYVETDILKSWETDVGALKGKIKELKIKRKKEEKRKRQVKKYDLE